jgi:hypothetical protein
VAWGWGARWEAMASTAEAGPARVVVLRLAVAVAAGSGVGLQVEAGREVRLAVEMGAVAGGVAPASDPLARRCGRWCLGRVLEGPKPPLPSRRSRPCHLRRSPRYVTDHRLA